MRHRYETCQHESRADCEWERWMRPVVYAVIATLLLVGAAWLLRPPPAHAQYGGFIQSGRSESTPDARFKRMWNATGSEILDGTVVMVDTVAAGTVTQIPLGKGFKTWDGTTGNFYRIVGLTVGNIPSYQQGRILVEGTHNNCLMAATGYTGWTRLRPSLTVAGALASVAAADSTNQYAKTVGLFQRYANTTSLRGYVYVNFSGQVLGK